MTTQTEPCGLYLHFPFCRSKCAYCDFNSVPDRGAAARGVYLGALRAEVRGAAAVPVDTIFCGGGTPTVYAAEELAVTLAEVASRFTILEGAEISLEANPGTVDEAALRRLRLGGFNRLSLGVQSFNDRLLAGIGRIHSAKRAREAVAAARAAGFTNLNLDLILGLPGEGEEWRDSVAQAIRLAPEHVSLYPLSVEEGTPLAEWVASEAVFLPEEDEVERRWRKAAAMLEAAGYRRYEISNFARPGFACRHNRRYWERREYLGLGAGAHSFLGSRRFWNVTAWEEYAARMQAGENPQAGEECLTAEEERGEAMILGLRLVEGISRRRFAARYGSYPEEAFPLAVERLTANGMLHRRGDRLALTARGRRLGNQAFAAFLPG